MPPAHGQGPRSAQSHPKSWWVATAVQLIDGYASQNLAVAPVELQSWLGGRIQLDQNTKPYSFDPHIVTEATRQLVSSGRLVKEQRITKGQHPVEILTTADTRLRSTAIDRAVGRKAMLLRRYQGPIAETAGQAGEDVVNHSLTEVLTAQGNRLTPVGASFGPVAALGGFKFVGSLDNGAWLSLVDEDGMPGVPAFIPIEVKNRRQVIYPLHKELHQLLSKAAAFHMAHPGRAVTPLLICRQAHWWNFRMAHDLGFLVHQLGKQYVYTSAPNATVTKIEEVREGLGLTDLHVLRRNGPQFTIRTLFETTIAAQSTPEAHARWRIAAALGSSTFDTLRHDTETPSTRQLLITQLRDTLTNSLEQDGLKCHGDWAALGDEEPGSDDAEPAYDPDVDGDDYEAFTW